MKKLRVKTAITHIRSYKGDVYMPFKVEGKLQHLPVCKKCAIMALKEFQADDGVRSVEVREHEVGLLIGG